MYLNASSSESITSVRVERGIFLLSFTCNGVVCKFSSALAYSAMSPLHCFSIVFRGIGFQRLPLISEEKD